MPAGEGRPKRNLGAESGEAADESSVGEMSGSFLGSTNSSAGHAVGDGPTPGDNLMLNLNDVTENLTALTRVNVADGWDVGTTPEAMSDDLLLGLRVGFCGCLSSFSSWNSSMVNLLKGGHISEALVGYIIGLQLPIVSYRFGQHVAVYWFIWRRRIETRRAERRGGYGLRLRESDDDDDEDSDLGEADEDDEDKYSDSITPRSRTSSLRNTSPDRRGQRRGRRKNGRILIEQEAAVAEREVPSVRAVATALMLLTLVMLVTSLSTFNRPDQQKFAISLLFSPLGVLARWRLQRYNHQGGRNRFPMGTFACNMLGCALSGSLGSFLAGNPGPEESVLLVGIISGFGGSLSTLAAFVVEILDLIDPILFKHDGMKYAFTTMFWALVIGLVTSQTRDWADELAEDL